MLLTKAATTLLLLVCGIFSRYSIWLKIFALINKFLWGHLVECYTFLGFNCPYVRSGVYYSSIALKVVICLVPVCRSEAKKLYIQGCLLALQCMDQTQKLSQCN